MSFAKRESWLAYLRLNLIGIGLLGLAFAFMAPFEMGSARQPLPTVAFWLSIMGLMWLQIAGPLSLGALAGWYGQRKYLYLAAAVVLLASVAGTLEVSWLQRALFGETRAGLIARLWIWLDILVVCALVTPPSVHFLAPRLARIATAPPPDPAPPGEIAFFRRIPPQLGRDLVALRMEDHYVRVFTLAGDGLIHCRFGDALYELRDFAGLRTHRSWYVALGQVAAVRRTKGRLKVVLRTGLEAPVSRTYARAVAAAGLAGGRTGGG